MKIRKCSLFVLFMVFVSFTAFAQGDYNTISLETLEASLPVYSTTVGFDVDDTVLLSSPGFHYAFTNTDGHNGSNRYGKKPLKSDAFWRDMNGFFDKFSMPKKIAKKVIAMHKRRGDKIIFVTARPASRNEILSSILKRTFGVGDVIFAGEIKKDLFIRRKGIKVFYGDADSDIRAAHDAGIRGIRILRSPSSTNGWGYNPGKYGEAVLENSTF